MYQVHEDITRAHTLPGRFYHDRAAFEASRQQVFCRSWQIVDLDLQAKKDLNVWPVTLLPDFLDEPLVLTRDGAQLRCLSNVCTHRGNVIVQKASKNQQLTCGYHGKCFGLDGAYKSMPGFEGAVDFPSLADNLPQYELQQLGPMLFTSLDPKESFATWMQPLHDRMSWFPFEQLEFAPALSKTYKLKAHWALYCENYLEGFHIPFVHEKLNKKLTFQAYRTDLYPFCNVQIGVARAGEKCFELPAGHPDANTPIYAYYWWLFPNIMINVYTWGVSLNIVKPRGIKKTEIVFKTYLLPDADKDMVAATALDETEMEDEKIVLQVQQGVGTHSYKKGRFSPSMERGVHHFQRLLADALQF